MELRKELDIQIKTLDGEIIRACNDFERETGLMIQDITVSPLRNEQSEIRRINVGLCAYPALYERNRAGHVVENNSQNKQSIGG
jgi:hypothetical protein